MNLVDVITSQLSNEAVLGSLGSLIGADSRQTKSATAAAVPALLGGLAKLASTDNGAGQIASALGGLDMGMLGNLAGMFGGSGAAKTADIGGSLLGSLFGNAGTSTLVNALSSFLGMKPGIAKSLLSYLAPVVLGQVASTFKGGRIDAHGVQSLLSSQAGNITGALPKGLSLGDFVSAASGAVQRPTGGTHNDERRTTHTDHSHARREPEPAGSGFPAWLPLLAIPLLGLGAWWYMSNSGQKKGGNQMAPPAVQMPRAGREAVEEVIEVTKPATEALTLPDNLVEAVKMGKDVTGLFETLSKTLGGVSDVATAEAAVPALKGLLPTLDAIKNGMGELPDAGKATVKEAVNKGMGGLSGIVETVMAIPGVGDILRPIVGPMLDVLKALGA
ncbi:MAG: DUF937 domain-containing protein [Pirellulales bacterium]